MDLSADHKRWWIVAGWVYVVLAFGYWDAVDPAPTGYRIYMAPAGQAYDYDNPIYDGNALSATVVIPNYNAEYQFVARAYLITPEGAEYESVDSNEVRHAIVMVVQNLRIE
jgi:hypothetical protein